MSYQGPHQQYQYQDQDQDQDQDQLTHEQECFCNEFGIPIQLVDFDRARRIQNAKAEYNARVQALLMQESRATNIEEKNLKNKELVDYLGTGLQELLKRLDTITTNK